MFITSQTILVFALAAKFTILTSDLDSAWSIWRGKYQQLSPILTVLNRICICLLLHRRKITNLHYFTGISYTGIASAFSFGSASIADLPSVGYMPHKSNYRHLKPRAGNNAVGNGCIHSINDDNAKRRQQSV